MNRPQESIYIKNFGGIEEALIPLNEINIFIGPQTSGKSVTAKLVYFFKTFWGLYYVNRGKYPNIGKWGNEKFISTFFDYFPEKIWKKSSFEIRYEYNKKYSVLIFKSSENSNIELTYSPDLIEDLSKFIKDDVDDFFLENKTTDFVQFINNAEEKIGKENFYYFQFYIPAIRSLFSTLQSSIFNVLEVSEGRNSFDPFLLRFGSVYEKIINKDIIHDEKSELYIDNILSLLKVSQIEKTDNRFYLNHFDSRSVNLSDASSGQQALFPLLLSLLSSSDTELFPSESRAIYVEEPEAHIFPDSQNQLVKFLVKIKNTSNLRLQHFITTHSPYILTAFNNLIQAGAIEQEIENKEDLYRIVPQHQILKPNTVNAYEFRDGKVESLIDPETGFIVAERLDAVSEALAIQFDQLLDLKYAVEK
jgi:predicted ATPase